MSRSNPNSAMAWFERVLHPATVATLRVMSPYSDMRRTAEQAWRMSLTDTNK